MAEQTKVKKNNTTKAKTKAKINTEKKIENKEKDVKTLNVATRPKLDPSYLVECVNMTQGKLVYISKKTGIKIVWGGFGDLEILELSELFSMRNSSPKFFTENWISIDDIDVINYLRVEQYYKNALNYEEFDKVFELSVKDFEDRIKTLSKGQQNSLVARASTLIREGKLDSIAKITAIEDIVGYNLTDLDMKER